MPQDGEGGEGVHVQIILFEVADAAAQTTLIDGIGVEVEAWVRHQPGFILSAFHKSRDGRHVANYARWQSLADWQAFTENKRQSEIGARIKAAGARRSEGGGPVHPGAQLRGSRGVAVTAPTVLVVGATGPTGREVVARAAARGHDVVALVRRRGGGAPTGARIETRQGDVLDPNSLKPALLGCDVVLCALGSGVSLRPMTMLSTGTRNLIDAMKVAGVRRLVCITGVGAGDSRGHGGFVYDTLIRPTILRQVYRDKDRQEQVVRDSGLDWTIVRPAQLKDGPRSRRLPGHHRPRRRHRGNDQPRRRGRLHGGPNRRHHLCRAHAAADRLNVTPASASARIVRRHRRRRPPRSAPRRPEKRNSTRLSIWSVMSLR